MSDPTHISDAINQSLMLASINRNASMTSFERCVVVSEKGKIQEAWKVTSSENNEKTILPIYKNDNL